MAREQSLIQKYVLLFVGMGFMAGLFATPNTQANKDIQVGCNCLCDSSANKCTCKCAGNKHSPAKDMEISMTGPNTITINKSGLDAVMETRVEVATSAPEPIATQQS